MQSVASEETATAAERRSSRVDSKSRSHSEDGNEEERDATAAEGGSDEGSDTPAPPPTPAAAATATEPTRGCLAVFFPSNEDPTKADRAKIIKFMMSHFGLMFLVIFYAVMGGVLFQYLEGGAEIYQRQLVSNKRVFCVSRLWNMTNDQNVLYALNWTNLADQILQEFQGEVVKAIMDNGWDGREVNNTEAKWSFSGALLFSATILTTIGYGNITPKTDSGRLATILYALLGIPLTLLFISTMGSTFAHGFRLMYKYFCRCYLCKKNHRKLARLRKKDLRVPVYISLMMIFGYIAGGAAMFSIWSDDWSYLIAAYFCFITLSTIGFGDYVFGMDDKMSDSFKLIIGAVYLMFGLSIIAMCFSLMQEEVSEKFFRLGIKLGIVEPKRKRKRTNVTYSGAEEAAGQGRDDDSDDDRDTGDHHTSTF